MGYFDDIPHTKPMTTFSELLQRVYERAEKVITNEYSYMKDMVDRKSNTAIIIDPYADYSPADSQCWLETLISVQENAELYGRLFYIRGGGTVLVRDKKWGFVLRPVIGKNGWESQQQYDEEKECLNPFRDEIIALLKRLGGKKNERV